MFAKSTSQQQQYRKSKAYARGSSVQQTMMHEEKKPASTKKSTKGESVTQVRTNEEYVLYKIENGKEIAVIQNGAQVTRTGRQILDKMSYNKRLGAWVSNAKGFKYRVRKK